MDFYASHKFISRAVSDNKTQIILTICCVLLIFSFLFFFYMTPGADIGPEQPISFSHRIHAGVKQVQCRFCHPYVNRSRFPGMPPVEKCLYCHDYIIPEHPQIQKEHEYYNANIPTPWVKVNYIPEHVFFNHKRHISQNVDCSECHGAVETMDRLKGTAFEMKFCITCHQERNVNLGCWLACHN